MKKFYIVLLSLILCVFIAACGQGDATMAESTEPETTTVPETTVPETTTPPTTEPPKEIHWTEEYYVDDFGDPTDESYIRGVFEGSFSNSATTGSDLTVCFFMDKNLAQASYDMFSIRLLEYGNQKATFAGCDEWDVVVKVKIDGEVIEDEADYLMPENGEIILQRGNAVFRAVLDALDAGKEISFAISEEGYGVSTYRFAIDANGLSDIPHKWKGFM